VRQVRHKDDTFAHLLVQAYSLSRLSRDRDLSTCIEMTSNAADGSLNSDSVHAHTPVHEKNLEEVKHLEQTETASGNLVYDDNDEEPELHARTYFALLAMFFLNLVQVFALQGPPAVVSNPRLENYPCISDWSELTFFPCSFPT
jgi:hypothetical protein